MKLIKHLLENRIVRYIISGVSIHAVNFGIFYILLLTQMEYQLANLIAITVAKMYGYLTQRFFVFNENNGSEVLTLSKYIIARVTTGLIEYFGLILLVEMINIGPLVSKNLMFFVILVLNYIFSRYLVFNRR